MKDLKDKVVVITGGAQGIGYAIAEKFLEFGSRVVITDINEDVLKEAASQLSAKGEVFTVASNVADESQVANMFEKIIEKYTNIDVLINNAGITADTLFIRMKKEAWQRVLDVNLTGTYLCISEAMKYMRKVKKGNIVNISSISANGNPGQTNYSASKAGVLGLTKALAKELAPMGIRANAVAPGFIKTKMTDAIPEKIQLKMLEGIPMRRIGEPEEIANTILFLASNLSSYITGEVINVNGGVNGVS